MIGLLSRDADYKAYNRLLLRQYKGYSAQLSKTVTLAFLSLCRLSPAPSEYLESLRGRRRLSHP